MSTVCEVSVISSAAQHLVEVKIDGKIIKTLGPFNDFDFAKLAAKHIASVAADSPKAVAAWSIE